MVDPDRSVVVKGSGIDIQDFLGKLPSPEEATDLKKQLSLSGQRVVIMVTLIVREKGVIEFLEAARIVCRKLPDVTFLLVGPLNQGRWQSVARRELESLTDQRVRYLGPHDDIPALLAISDLFVLPTYYREGVPRVLLEAGATGLPIVTTDMPGCRDVVKNGWNGLLVPPSDVKALAAALERLLVDRPAAHAMGVRGRAAVVASFDADTNIGALYDRFVSAGAAS